LFSRFIPFTFTVQSRPNFSFEQSAFWMRPNASEEQRTITLPYLDSDVSRQWVLGNMNHAGFYRVNYDTQNWQLLIEQLNSDHELIDVVNRATLIDDAFNLAKAEYVDQTMFLSLISYLKNETDALPFELVGESLAYFATMLSQNYTTFGVFKVGSFNKNSFKYIFLVIIINL
jgi:aminopeptidase N